MSTDVTATPETSTANGPQEDTGSLDMDFLAEYVELDTRRKELEAEAEKIRAKLARMHDALLKDMLEQGVKSVNINGQTAYIRPDFICTKRAGVPAALVVQALRDSGLGGLVSTDYNAASLKSRVKELHATNSVPLALEALLNIQTLNRIIVRNGTT